MIENKGDLISREALKKSFEDTVCIEPMPYAFVKQIIDNAPTVEIPNYGGQVVPDTLHGWRYEERPHGEWIVFEDSIFGNFKKCSNCNEGAEWLDGGSQFLSNFCPNCGADMRGKEE